jgi:hypothetical protein
MLASGLIGVCVLVASRTRAQNAQHEAAPSKLVQAAKSALEAATTMYEVGQADAEEVYR